MYVPRDSSRAPAVLFIKLNLESGKVFLNWSTWDLSLLLNRNAALLSSATHTSPFVPRVDMAFGVHPIRPSPTIANFLAPLLCSFCTHPINISGPKLIISTNNYLYVITYACVKIEIRGQWTYFERLKSLSY